MKSSCWSHSFIVAGKQGIMYKLKNPRRGGTPGAGVVPFGNGSYDSGQRPDYPGIPHTSQDVYSALRDAAASIGVLVPACPVIDKLTRCGTEGRERGKDGAYCLHLDGGIPAGFIQNFRTGEKLTWRYASGGFTVDTDEIYERRRQIEAERRKWEAERTKRHAEAAVRAERLWNEAKPASPEHPYLKRKGVESHGVREWRGRIVIPVMDASGAIQSLQFISPDGSKRFLSGGRLYGGRFLIGGATDPSGTILICEGYATAATLHEQTGYSVYAAFSAGNLEAVAVSVRAKHPRSKIVICGDNDHETEARTGRNPGIESAKLAAVACGGSLSVPPSLSGVSDWNDYAALNSRRAVKP